MIFSRPDTLPGALPAIGKMKPITEPGFMLSMIRFSHKVRVDAAYSDDCYRAVPA
jgi:hypothetical protein